MNDLAKEIQTLIVDLASENYDKIESDGRAGRLSAREIKATIDQYGRTLRPLPDEAWGLIEEYSEGKCPGTIAIDVPLWTVEEGRSDLTLLLSVKIQEGIYLLEIDDLRVL